MLRQLRGSGAWTGGVRVLTSIEFLNGTTKVFETPLVVSTALNEPAKGAVAFQLDLPLTDLKPGLYVAQVNVIDDTGGGFTFPRMALLVKEGAAPAVAPVPGVAPAPGATPPTNPPPPTGRPLVCCFNT